MEPPSAVPILRLQREIEKLDLAIVRREALVRQVGSLGETSDSPTVMAEAMHGTSGSGWSCPPEPATQTEVPQREACSPHRGLDPWLWRRRVYTGLRSSGLRHGTPARLSTWV
jgi:hypothetical protein